MFIEFALSYYCSLPFLESTTACQSTITGLGIRFDLLMRSLRVFSKNGGLAVGFKNHQMGRSMRMPIFGLYGQI